jgi:PIN domain nuclease of toxin-antitoxin system
VREWPLTGEVGIAAATLLDFHPDPADRFITATALLYGATLVTADDRILTWSGTLRRHDARQ